MLTFSANIGLLFTELPFTERFKAARLAGFDAVEFPFPEELGADELRGLLVEAEVVQSLANMPYEVADLGLAAAPCCESKFQERLVRALRYAHTTGCKVLHVLAGKIPPGTDADLCENVLRKNLRYAATVAADAGIMVVVEAINRRDVPDFSLESVHHAAAIVESLGISNVGLLLDLYHAGTVGEDMPSVVARYAHLAGYVQLAGFSGRHEPCDGAADYAHLLNLLLRSGYEGYVGCEYRPLTDTVFGLSWLSEVKKQLR